MLSQNDTQTGTGEISFADLKAIAISRGQAKRAAMEGGSTASSIDKESLTPVTVENGFEFFRNQDERESAGADIEKKDDSQPKSELLKQTESYFVPSAPKEKPIKLDEDNSYVDQSATEPIKAEETVEPEGPQAQPSVDSKEELKLDFERIELESALADHIAQHNKISNEVAVLSDQILELGEKCKMTEKEVMNILNRDEIYDPAVRNRVRDRLTAQIQSELADKRNHLDEDKKIFDQNVLDLESKKKQLEEIAQAGAETLLKILDTFKLEDMSRLDSLLGNIDRISLDIQQKLNDERLSHDWPHLCALKRFEILKQVREAKERGLIEDANFSVDKETTKRSKLAEILHARKPLQKNITTELATDPTEENVTVAEEIPVKISNSSTSNLTNSEASQNEVVDKSTTETASPEFVEWKVISPTGQEINDNAAVLDKNIQSSKEKVVLDEPEEAKAQDLPTGEDRIQGIKDRLTSNEAVDNSSTQEQPRAQELSSENHKESQPANQKPESEIATTKGDNELVPDNKSTEMHFLSDTELKNPSLLPRIFQKLLRGKTAREYGGLEKTLITARNESITKQN